MLYERLWQGYITERPTSSFGQYPPKGGIIPHFR